MHANIATNAAALIVTSSTSSPYSKNLTSSSSCGFASFAIVVAKSESPACAPTRFAPTSGAFVAASTISATTTAGRSRSYAACDRPQT